MNTIAAVTESIGKASEALMEVRDIEIHFIDEVIPGYFGCFGEGRSERWNWDGNL